MADDIEPLMPPASRHVNVVTACKECGGPVIYERNELKKWLFLVCCGCFALLCLPEREAECAACGAKQGYSIPNTHLPASVPNTRLEI